MIAANKTKGPRACSTCARAKSRCVPGPVPNICERCQRLGKSCGSQVPMAPRRRRPEGGAGGPQSSAAGGSAATATATQRARIGRPTRVSELERRLEDLTTRLESVSRHQRVSPPQPQRPKSPDATATRPFFLSNRPMPYYPMTHIFADKLPQQAASGRLSPSPTDSSPASSNNQGNNQGSNQGSTSRSAPDADPEPLPPFTLFPSMSLRRPPTPPTAAAKALASKTLPHKNPAIATPPLEDLATTNTAHTGPEAHAVPAAAAAPELVGNFWPESAEAETLLREFRSNLMPLLPFVLVPDHVSADQLLARRPFMWKAVMMSTCHLDGERQMSMGNQLLTDLTSAALLQPKRSIDVLQAFHLVVSWFHYSINSFQLTNIFFLIRGLCVSLSLGEPPRGGLLPPGSTYPSETLERMRLFAGTFYLVSLTTTNKKPDMMMNTPFLETCCQVLESQKEYPSDSYLVQLVRIQQLSQSILVGFSMRTAGMQMDLSINFLVENFEQQIACYQAQLPEQLAQDPCIIAHIRIAEIMTYEVALQEDAELTVLERSNLLAQCMKSTKAFLHNRFAEPILEQPRFICLTSFDFVYGFLTALRMIMFQTPGWDPRQARQQLDFDRIVDRQISDLQRLSRRRSLRSSRKPDNDAPGQEQQQKQPPYDPYNRLVSRLSELKAMLARELDRLPTVPETAVVTLDTNMTAEHDFVPMPPPAEAAFPDTTIVPPTDLADSFDIGMIDAAPAIFDFADATVDYMRNNLDGSTWPDLFGTADLEGYLDGGMGTPSYDNSWGIS